MKNKTVKLIIASLVLGLILTGASFYIREKVFDNCSPYSNGRLITDSCMYERFERGYPLRYLNTTSSYGLNGNVIGFKIKNVYLTNLLLDIGIWTVVSGVLVLGISRLVKKTVK